MEKVSKEKMDNISKDLEKLESNLKGLSKEQLEEVAAGLQIPGSALVVKLVTSNAE